MREADLKNKGVVVRQGICNFIVIGGSVVVSIIIKEEI